MATLSASSLYLKQKGNFKIGQETLKFSKRQNAS